ncbi:MAG: DUF2878 domain-containing protein [Gammaproteobacteria bacterium]|nr:DUF2878 domain-containing protein [Gammaproteobacteria bacterium]
MNRLIVANLVAFNACWFANVLGGGNGIPWFGPMVTGLWLTAHMFWLNENGRTSIRLLWLAGALGYAGDSALVALYVIAFPESAALGGPSTIWMVALWVAFAATLNHSMRWLQGRLALALIFGAIGGPLAYWSGTKLGAITFPSTDTALVAVGVEWAVLLPVLVYFSARWSPQSATRQVPLPTEGL